MGCPAQVGAFAVGERAGTVVKQVGTTGVWRIVVEGVRVAEGGELMMS